MTQQCDEEFEKYWEKKVAEGELTMFKPFAEMVWKDVKQAVKTPSQPEVKKLELEGGDWFINSAAVVSKCETAEDTAKAGRERKTRELAESAAVKMRKRDALHAHATEIMGYEYEYKINSNDRNCFVGYHHDTKKFYVDSSCVREIIGVIYMTRACAETLRDALNDGRLVL